MNTKIDDNYISIDEAAEYYNIQLESNKPLRGQPGLESITKQYLYQLAFRNFINEHNFTTVKNCFLMPTQENEIVPKGHVAMDMLSGLGLEPIQNRLIPAKKAYELYLHGQRGCKIKCVSYKKITYALFFF